MSTRNRVSHSVRNGCLSSGEDITHIVVPETGARLGWPGGRGCKSGGDVIIIRIVIEHAVHTGSKSIYRSSLFFPGQDIDIARRANRRLRTIGHHLCQFVIICKDIFHPAHGIRKADFICASECQVQVKLRLAG